MMIYIMYRNKTGNKLQGCQFHGKLNIGPVLGQLLMVLHMNTLDTFLNRDRPLVYQDQYCLFWLTPTIVNIFHITCHLILAAGDAMDWM